MIKTNTTTFDAIKAYEANKTTQSALVLVDAILRENDGAVSFEAITDSFVPERKNQLFALFRCPSDGLTAVAVARPNTTSECFERTIKFYDLAAWLRGIKRTSIELADYICDAVRVLSFDEEEDDIDLQKEPSFWWAPAYATLGEDMEMLLHFQR